MHIKTFRLLPESYPARDAYPFNLGILSSPEPVVLENPVTFFAGENGSGKTTLLRALARKCRVHIWKDETRSTSYNNPHEETLHRHIEVEWSGPEVPGSFFASEIFQYFAQSLDEWSRNDPGMFQYFGGSSLLTRSHGQRHLAYFKSRYRIEGVYFLDEPENALSPKRQLEFMRILHEAAEGGRAQFIIATHSPILLAYPRSAIYSFDHPAITRVRYEETDYYRIYRDFMLDRDRFLDAL